MTRKLRVAVIDLVPQGPASSLWARVMNANMGSIMSSVVAAWCERQGHEVAYFTCTGFEDLHAVLNEKEVWFSSAPSPGPPSSPMQ